MFSLKSIRGECIDRKVLCGEGYFGGYGGRAREGGAGFEFPARGASGAHWLKPRTSA